MKASEQRKTSLQSAVWLALAYATYVAG